MLWSSKVINTCKDKKKSQSVSVFNKYIEKFDVNQNNGQKNYYQVLK